MEKMAESVANDTKVDNGETLPDNIGKSGLSFEEIDLALNSILGWKDKNKPVVNAAHGGDFFQAASEGAEILKADPSFAAAFRNR